MPRTHIFATVDPAAVSRSVQEAAAAGQMTFHIRRSDGTLRRMSYLRPGTAERRVAERIAKARDRKVPMREIAGKLHVSVPTVRRIINNLELSLRVEAGELNYAIELIEGQQPATFQQRRASNHAPAARQPVTAGA